MRNIVPYRSKRPRIHKDAYIDPAALVIGDVVIEEKCSVWPGAIIRADEEAITLERGVAVMDRAFIEAPSGHPVVVEENTLVSHGAILHGCEVGEGCLIGIGAIVLEDAKVEDGSIVGAGALVVPGALVESGTLFMGSPAKMTRKLKAKDEAAIKKGVKQVRRKARVYKKMYEEGGDHRSYIR